MAVGGHVGYFSATYDNPQHVIRFRSSDGGISFDKGTNITYDIYDLYDEKSIAGKTKGIFLTSGKIFQSRYVKVGSHYRLYIAHPFRGEKSQADYVIYSDDFGDTWKVLGGTSQMASTGNDESKVEEMPDGSVIISSRVQSGGRTYNVFSYTNIEKGEGTWSACATPGNMQSSMINACNGAVMVVPVVRKADNKQMYLALQSVPLSSSRIHVGFFYKPIETASDYITGAALAQNWTRGLQVTNQNACYSEMVLMDNDSIGFVYEELSYNGGYDIVFKTLSIDTITGGAFTIDPSYNETARYMRENLQARMQPIMSGTYVGCYETTESLPTEEAMAELEANTTMQGMIDAYNIYQEKLSTLKRIGIKENTLYRLRNYREYTAGQFRYLSTNGTTLTTINAIPTDSTDLFLFEPASEEGKYLIKSYVKNVYADLPIKQETIILTKSSAAEAGAYMVKSTPQGLSALVASATIPAIHNAIDGRIVPWYANGPEINQASYWYIEPVSFATGVSQDKLTDDTSKALFDLQGRRITRQVQKGIYIINGKKVLK